MDRAETPRRLDGLIEPDSGVALFADTHPEAPEHAWRAAWQASLDRYCEPGRPPRGRAGRLDRHHSVLRDPAFPVLTVMRVVERRMISS
jgi:hypothetical protein